MKWLVTGALAGLMLPALTFAHPLTPTQFNCDVADYNRPNTLHLDMSENADVQIASQLLLEPSQHDKRLYQSTERYTESNLQLFIDTNYVCFNKGSNGYVVVPSIVTSGASGVFYYLTLYQVNPQRWMFKNEVFLGDRVELNSLSFKGDQFHIVYSEHGIDQAMAEHPQQTVSREFRITDNKLTEQSN
ncbi:hypothetical protein [Vibrio gallicus]|uniref:hypothetical protein n=1 Tax=Vibrio gallicus TaxID=190897 RepID=UPI0021C473F6|nr:hypothetical protein [Vibrio gallicus]